MDWLPIESAPKDGEEILVVHRDNRSFMQIVGWDDDQSPARPDYPWMAPDGPAYRREAFDYWQPLPEPPHD